MSRAPLTARLLRRWHKRLGLLAALFVVFLALSGLALNHGEALDLDQTELSTPWLMAWYGLKPSVPEQAFASDGTSFCAQGEVWVLAGRRVKPGHGEPLGAIAIEDVHWVATANEIVLYDREGRSVDKIGRELLPAVPIHRIGVWQGRLVANADGTAYASTDGITWNNLPERATVTWSRPAPLSEAQRRELAPLFAPTLPLQRIVADAHSGRIFGPYGVLVTDLLAAILLILALSGGWLFLGARRQKNKPKRDSETNTGRTQAPPVELP